MLDGEEVTLVVGTMRIDLHQAAHTITDAVIATAAAMATEQVGMEVEEAVEVVIDLMSVRMLHGQLMEMILWEEEVEEDVKDYRVDHEGKVCLVGLGGIDEVYFAWPVFAYIYLINRSCTKGDCANMREMLGQVSGIRADREQDSIIVRNQQ